MQDSIALINLHWKQFLHTDTLVIDDKAIIDSSSKILYVIYNDFKKKYFLTYIIDGIIYKQETGLSDALGIIMGDHKDNKELKNKLKSMKDDLDNYTIHVYQGLEAYKKFGYDCVFGVIVLQRKN